MKNARTRTHRVLTTIAVTGAMLVGGVATAPAATAIEYVTVTGDGFLTCTMNRALKINQLEKLGYATDAGNCAQLLNKYIVKIAYWKK